MPNMVCPWWLAYSFDNALRRFFHNPEKMFSRFIGQGDSAMDIGCGMGVFSIGLAGMIGNDGTVFSVDLQKEMLDIVNRRKLKYGVKNTIQTLVADRDNDWMNAFSEEIDFVLTFWMVHETPDQKRFLDGVHGMLKHGGKLFLAEPKVHVSSRGFDETASLAVEAGFKELERPPVWFSRAAVFMK